MLKDIKKKKLNTVTLNSGKQLSPAEVEAKQKAVRKLQVHNDDNNNNNNNNEYEYKYYVRQIQQ